MANNVIDRNSLSGLIPEPVTREILQGAVAESAVLRMARRLPNSFLHNYGAGAVHRCLQR